MRKNEIVLEEWKINREFNQAERIVCKKTGNNVLLFKEFKLPARSKKIITWNLNVHNLIPIQWATKIHKAWGKK